MAGSTTRAAYYVMKDAVPEERLRELRIRARESTDLGQAGTAEEMEDPVVCWVVTLSGVKKLRDYGYSADNIVRMSEEEEVYFVALANPDGTPATADVDPNDIKVVRIPESEWNGDNNLKEFLHELASEILCPAFNKHVTIRVPHNRAAAFPDDDKTFYVFIWSSNCNGHITHPSTMWGYEVACTDSSSVGLFVEGTPITCSEGEEVAAFGEKGLYIYHDAVELDTDNSRSILRKIFEETARLYTSGEASGPKLELVRERYVKACSSRITATRRDLTRSIKDWMGEIDDLKQRLNTSIKEYRHRQCELDNLDNLENNIGSTLRKEFDNLCKVDKVESVDWRGNSMVVTTKKLYVIHTQTGDEYEIGAFKIVIDERTSSVLFFNLTRRVDAYQNAMNGPHIFPDGRPCLGSMESVIPQLVAKYEWSALIQMCIAFVESINLADIAGKHLSKWPISRTKQQVDDNEPRPGEEVEEEEPKEESVPDHAEEGVEAVEAEPEFQSAAEAIEEVTREEQEEEEDAIR